MLQEREFDRLGDTRTISVDLRVIATTNRALAADGARRPVPRRSLLPPERDPAQPAAVARARRGRRVNWPSISRASTPRRASPRALTPDFLAPPGAHVWPGNVRELANCVRRAVALATGRRRLEPERASNDSTKMAAPRAPRHAARSRQPAPGVSLGEMERKLVEMTLDATGGNRSRAAELLGVSLRTVRNKVRELWTAPRSSYVRTSLNARKGDGIDH